MRRLAVHHVLFRQFSISEVAKFCCVTEHAVRNWVHAFIEEGDQGLSAKPHVGRPQKLNYQQEKIFRKWIKESPIKFGYDTELWSAPRLTKVISKEFRVQMHPHYLVRWMRGKGLTPQKPLRVAHEADPAVIEKWLMQDWPRIKKKQLKTRHLLH